MSQYIVTQQPVTQGGFLDKVDDVVAFLILGVVVYEAWKGHRESKKERWKLIEINTDVYDEDWKTERTVGYYKTLKKAAAAQQKLKQPKRHLYILPDRKKK